MQVISDGSGGVLSTLCKLSNQWGLYIHVPSPEWYKDVIPSASFYDELYKAAPILREYRDDLLQSIIDGHVYIFGTQEEINREYNRVVGDDGPTYLNPYNGKVHVYALTCDNTGELMTENT